MRQLPIPDVISSMPTINAEMDVIQRRSQLLRARSGIVRTAIADPTILDVVQYSPTELAVIGLQFGSTTLTMWFEDEVEPTIYLVRVIRDPSLEDQQRIDYGKLEKKINLLFPNSKVYLIPISNKIIVRGQAHDSEEAHWILSLIRGEIINQNGSLAGPQPIDDAASGPDIVNGQVRFNGQNRLNSADIGASQIINQLFVPGEFQIMLRVRIVELNRSMLRRFGVDGQVLWDNAQNAVTTSLLSGSTLTGVFADGDVNVSIDALRSNGTAKLLAEPNLTVLSGHDASFLSGGTFAVPTIVGIGGVGGQQTVFRGVGTSVVVTPTIIDRDLIRMRIRPEFSEINPDNTSAGILGTNTRNLNTTIQLREGQTLVLGGLISHRTNTEVTGIPILESIPIVGPALFQTKRSTEDETELLITVTPEIVRPLEPDEVPPYPGFEVTVPNNHMLYWKGFTQGPNDLSVNQLAPYGHGSGVGVPIGYGQFNPQPSTPGYAPAPAAPFGGGYSSASGTGSNSRYAGAPFTPRPPAPGYTPPAMQGRGPPPGGPAPSATRPGFRPTTSQDNGARSMRSMLRRPQPQPTQEQAAWDQGYPPQQPPVAQQAGYYQPAPR